MNDLATPIEDPHEPERSARLRHGHQNLDSVGLFIQWLSEQLVLLPGPPRFSVRLDVDVEGVGVGISMALVPEPGGAMISHRWTVDRLNELHLIDRGRGNAIRDEISQTMKQIREQLCGTS